MAVIYDNLWNLIAKKGMTRSQLREAAGISTNAMVKLGKNESVQIEVLSKICGVLNCTFDDVVENTGDDALICHLPKIHFNHFNYGVDEQFNTLGLETLEDFPHPHTVKSFSKTLTRYFRECKLGLDACEEFITALSDTGIEVHLLPDVIPEEKYFPQYIPSEDEDNTDESRYKLEWQQATNYVNWHLHKYSQSKQMIDAVVSRMGNKYDTKKEIEVLIAEKKLEQQIMNLMPLGMLLFLQISAWEYMEPLYHNGFGVFCMTICLVGYVTAWILSENILRIQV